MKNWYFCGINPIKMLIKDPEKWFEFYIVSGIEFLSIRLFKKKVRFSNYGGKKIISANKAQTILIKAINENKPYMAGRLGATELEFCYECDFYKDKIISRIRTERLQQKCLNNGFFPSTEEAFMRFSELMKDSLINADFLGVSYSNMEGYYCKKYLRNESQLTERECFDFWNYIHPFSMALKGKRVLVIHPFSQTIEMQYKKRRLLFDNKNYLPEFTLKTLKAVQTSAGGIDNRFQNWFDALEYMTKEALKIDFDVAIIACGAYGFPLASRIKSAGRIAIHMGGVTQILFGIKGRRWDKHPTASLLYNKHWVRPSDIDIPPNTEKVENSCYW